MKLDEIIWTEISDDPFRIIRSNIFAEGAQIKITRNINYQITFLIEVDTQEQYLKIREAVHLSLNTYIVAVNKIPNLKLFIKGIFPEHLSFGEKKYTLEGVAISATAYLRPKKLFEQKYTHYYFLNSLSNFHYTRSQIFSSKEEIFFEITGFSNEDYSFAIGESISNNILQLEIGQQKVIIGEVSSSVSKSVSGTYIRTASPPGISDEVIDDLGDFLSFIGGSKLIRIGKSKIASYFTKIEKTFFSNFLLGLDHHLSKSPYIPYPYFSGFKEYKQIEKTLSTAFEKFRSLKEIFNLKQIVFLISHARTTTFELQIQPLATAYDTLKSRWFNSSFSSSKGKNLQDNEYSNIIREFINPIRIKLGSEKPTTDPILNRVKKANVMTLSEKDPVFFAELNLDVGDIERFALNSRHSIVHGNHGEKDYHRILDANNAYHTMLNRIMLRILGLSHYIDHTYPSNKRYVDVKEKMLGPVGNFKPRD